MTPNEARLELDADHSDPDYAAHEAAYVMFARIMKWAAVAVPFAMALILTVTD